MEDVDRGGRRLWVLGKGRAQKEARTLPAPTLEAIERWLVQRDAVAGEDEAALFVNTALLQARAASDRPRALSGHPEPG